MTKEKLGLVARIIANIGFVVILYMIATLFRIWLVDEPDTIFWIFTQPINLLWFIPLAIIQGVILTRLMYYGGWKP